MNRDVMQSAGLEIYAELGIILFVFAFTLVLVRVAFMKKSEAHERGNIPLEDGTDEVPV